jgi:hypothetical protein
MSAVPKKKLCWNCDGSVSKEIDNCPYCGVYVHATEPETSSFWGPSYRKGDDEEKGEIHLPSYQSKEEKITPVNQIEINEDEAEAAVIISFPIWPRLRDDVLPILLLMSGSVFFLFGVILFLFAHEGTLTLQWNGDHWVYFLGCSIPFFFLGRKYLQKMS